MAEKTAHHSDGGPRPTPERDAQVILSNEPGSFARGVLANRHPALIEQVRDAFPYGPRQHEALDALLEQNNNGVIEPLAPSEPDHEQWSAWGRELFGRSWFDAPFLWSESYFYRRLLSAVGYFGAGPWQGVDPFAPFKRAELRGTAVDEELRALDALADVPADERATALLHASVRGNRADLGFRVTEGDAAPGAAADDLVADDSAQLWQLLPAGAGVTVAVVADNAGRELIPDLILIDHLLLHRHAERIVLHVKPYPYYVSDAMTADVVDCLRRLAEAPGGGAGRGGPHRQPPLGGHGDGPPGGPGPSVLLRPAAVRGDAGGFAGGVRGGHLDDPEGRPQLPSPGRRPDVGRDDTVRRPHGVLPRGRRGAAHTEVRRDRGVGAEHAGGAGTVRRGLAYERYACLDPGSRVGWLIALNQPAEQRTETGRLFIYRTTGRTTA